LGKASLPRERTIMPISEFCNRNVVIAGRDTTAIEAAALMRQHHVGDVIVVDQVDGRRRPVGLVTDRDLVVEIMASGLDPRLPRMGDLLLWPLVTVDEDASYAETVRLMSVNGVRRIPVVGRSGELVGIVTLDDMLWHMAGPLAALSALSGRSRNFETETRK
jgi:CBS domain-containing protein